MKNTTFIAPVSTFVEDAYPTCGPQSDSREGRVLDRMNTLTKPVSMFLLGTSVLGLLAGCNKTSSEPASMASPIVKATPKPLSEMEGMSMAMGTTGMEALKKLKAKDFDTAFLSQMIAHHEAAVTMAKQALVVAKKTETKQNAQKVIDAQTKEIAQMTGWLKDWYKATPDTAQQALVNADMKAMMSMPVTSDTMFFDMMIPHHQGAIEMSVLAKTQSARLEVKKLAEDIIAAQKKEIKDYQKRMG